MKSESTEAGATNFSFDDDENDTTESDESLFRRDSSISASNTNTNSASGSASSSAGNTDSVDFSRVTEDSTARVQALASSLSVESVEEDVPPPLEEVEEESGDLY